MFELPVDKQSPGFAGSAVGVLGAGMDDFSKYVALRDARLAAGAVGVDMLVAWGRNPEDFNTSVGLTDQRLFMIPMIVKGGVGIDGVAWVQDVAGSYTANNNNKIAAFSFDGTTFTRVAQSGNIAAAGQLWKSASGFQTQPFSAQYVPPSDMILWAAGLYCNSAVVTQPLIIGSSEVLSTGVRTLGLGTWAFQMDFAAQTNMPATIAAAGGTANNNIHEWLGFYHTY